MRIKTGWKHADQGHAVHLEAWVQTQAVADDAMTSADLAQKLTKLLYEFQAAHPGVVFVMGQRPGWSWARRGWKPVKKTG